MFLEEITDNSKYKDVYIVPISAGIEYMKNPAPSVVLANWGKADISPFGCESIEAGIEYMKNPAPSVVLANWGKA